MATRPAIFKWRQTEPVLISARCAGTLRYSLSLRDVEELLKERGLEIDHTTVWRCPNWRSGDDVGDGRAVDRCQVRIDDTRLRMGWMAQRLPK